MNFSTLFLLCISWILITEKATSAEELEVSIKNGKMLGSQMRTSKGRDFYAFRGIPYAKPPTDDLRFKLPVAAEPWDGILNATVDGNVCPQISLLSDDIIGDEDCLILNVYTPKLPSSNDTNGIPVMVFIHGGGFIHGSGNSMMLGPNRLLDKDIVLVTINYRLGALGFLSMNDDVLPGNYGLFDQIMALKWVQENIFHFGGDPARVTIFGESAGASSVSHLLLSPKAKDLFYAAIMESGNSFCGFSTEEHSRKTAKLFAIKLNCPVYNSSTIVECMANKTTADLLMAADEMGVLGFLPLLFIPVVENTTSGYFPSEPCELVSRNLFNNVPVIMGINRNEGAMSYAMFSGTFDQTSEDFLKEDLKWIIPMFPRIHRGEKLSVDSIRDKYFGNPLITDKELIKHRVIDLYSAMFGACTDRARKFLADAGTTVYTYKFTYRGDFSTTELFDCDEDLGVSHADELQYLFYSPLLLELKGNDVAMSEIMLSLWTNFAETRNPTPDGRFMFKWEKTQFSDYKYLDIKLNPEMKSEGFSNMTEFWMDDIKKTCN